ncbi:MAG: hypothetical protein ABIP54_02190 [Candidatus Andersenbacteria bacterium]
MSGASRNNFRVTPNSEQVPIQIVGSNTYGRYQKIGSGETFNMFISDDWLINTAGYQRLADFVEGALGAGRGLFHSVRGNLVLAVVNSAVYLIDAALTITQIGSIASTSGEVFMDENLNSQIAIVDGLNLYIYNYDLGGAPVVQTGGPLGSTLIPNYVSFHNTFFNIGNAVTDSNGAGWYTYGFASATTVSLVSMQTLSTKPDNAIAVKRLPGQSSNVIVFGKSVCEVWTQVGGLQNYRRNSTINIDYGCASTSTIASGDLYTAWLAINENNTPVIMIYSGQGVERISTDGIDYLLQTVQFPSQSTAEFYRQDGHLFYQLTFYNAADDFTLLYDLNTKKFFTLTDQYGSCHPARQIVYLGSRVLFISLKNAALYESATSITNYNENISTAIQNPLLAFHIPRRRICESIRKPDSGRFIANSCTFTMAQGDDPNVTGISIAQNAAAGTIGYRPRVDMRISYDSGITWSNTDSRNLNALGNRQNIITFGKLGACNDLTIEFEFWGNSYFAVSDGFVEVY